MNITVNALLNATSHCDGGLARELLNTPLAELMAHARELRDDGHGDTLSYSRKVFIPLTQLCRDVCHYCTFSRAPGPQRRAYLDPSEVLAIASAGKMAACDEALFTLGDRPEDRWAIAREALDRMGHASTLDYLHASCASVIEHTGLLPHVNAGLMSREWLIRMREVSVSMGLMLENISERLCQRGQAHFGSPDKHPARRMAMIETAGELAIPFTSGILIGIGETREERIDSLFALRDVHLRHGHLQEIIIQNFRAKPDTPMQGALEPDFNDLCWTIAAARIIFGKRMNIQAPPNLSASNYGQLVAAGINDWGGISPVTRDHVNPEAAWPQVQILEAQSAANGKRLAKRLAIYPAWAQSCDTWVAPGLRPSINRRVDARGWPRTGDWVSGSTVGSAECFASPPMTYLHGRSDDYRVAAIIDQCLRGQRASVEQVETLFNATGAALHRVVQSADQLRRDAVGDTVRYVVNRNINYTNVCTLKCGFCAFSRGRAAEHLRGAAYDLDEAEIRRRVAEAWTRGATEVCMQGGIHPDYDGNTYLDIVRMVKAERAAMHVHAFSPLEVWHGASTLKVPLRRYLEMLREAGLGTLPGTAAEILDDDVRTLICPEKVNTEQWLGVMRAAHQVGIRSTATMMFGHLERPVHWARHLLALRDLQQETGGFTEFVPLSFIATEAPLFLKGRARLGPTAREALLVHAVARLVLHPHIANIQVSWVKLGPEGVRACLAAGANDLGGTLMNESISRAAGGCHGQEMGPASLDALIRASGRQPDQRTTLYTTPDILQRQASYSAQAVSPIVLTPVVFAKTRRARLESMEKL